MSYCFLVSSQSLSMVLPTHCHRHYEATYLEVWCYAQYCDKYHDNLKSSGKIATDAVLVPRELMVFVWSIRTYQRDQSSVVQ
jgi:hypothetical protein